MTSTERHEARYQRRKKMRYEKRMKFLSESTSFDLVTDIDALNDACKKAKKGVSWKGEVQKYENNKILNLLETQEKLRSGESILGKRRKFIVNERGKTRIVESYEFSERVVQTSLTDNVLLPVFRRQLIYDSGASLKGKGVKFSRKRLCKHLHSFYKEESSNNGFALTIDFKNYFGSIVHESILCITRPLLIDYYTYRLYAEFVNANRNKVGDNFEKIGLGLGSPVSQVSALIFPNKVFTFLKTKLRIKHLIVHMDDVVIIHKSKEFLKKCLVIIKDSLSKIGISLHERKTKITPLKCGISFLKGTYFLKNDGAIKKYPKSANLRRKIRKLRKAKKLLEEKKITARDCWSSYKAMDSDFKFYNAFRQRKFLASAYNKLFVYGG